MRFLAPVLMAAFSLQGHGAVGTSLGYMELRYCARKKSVMMGWFRTNWSLEVLPAACLRLVFFPNGVEIKISLGWSFETSRGRP